MNKANRQLNAERRLRHCAWEKPGCLIQILRLIGFNVARHVR